MDDDLKAYRQSLVDTMRLLNESYDKLLVTLSGGALGLSIGFLKDVLGWDEVVGRGYLVSSWIAFTFSLAAVLGRVLSGLAANRRAIEQVDAGRIYKELPGGMSARVTQALLYCSAALLIAGLLLLTLFAYLNAGRP